jgi:hypothetical protein
MARSGQDVWFCYTSQLPKSTIPAVLALATLLSLVSTRSNIKKDSETVRRFLMAYTDGVERLYIDKWMSC